MQNLYFRYSFCVWLQKILEKIVAVCYSNPCGFENHISSIKLRGVIFMNQQKKTRQVIEISLMLFAMFFGAGNMIFPPMLGHLGGTNYFLGTLGFILTDAGLSILGIAAIVLVGSKISDLGNLIGPKFAVFFGLAIYFLIGPLFALPRTATVSFSMAVEPFTGENPGFIYSVIFSALFFLVTYALCINPSRMVDVVGKILTPVLLISIAVIFIVSVFNPVGEIGAPKGDYAAIPLFKGVVEGYLAMDGFAALAFAIVVIDAMKDKGITEPKEIARYTVFSGIFAGVALGVVYLALGYVGAQTSSGPDFANGGSLLTSVVNTLLGPVGNIVLGVAVLFACHTTSIGLASSFSDFFTSVFPKFTYRQILTAVCLFSFAVANVGLTKMIAITLPVLIMVYPPVIVLTLSSFGKKIFGNRPEPYAFGMIFAVTVGAFDGLKAAGLLAESFASTLGNSIPWFDLGIGWVLPSLIGIAVGMLVKKAKYGKLIGNIEDKEEKEASVKGSVTMQN